MKSKDDDIIMNTITEEELNHLRVQSIKDDIANLISILKFSALEDTRNTVQSLLVTSDADYITVKAISDGKKPSFFIAKWFFHGNYNWFVEFIIEISNLHKIDYSIENPL